MAGSEPPRQDDETERLIAAARAGDRGAKEQLLLVWLPQLRQFLRQRMSRLLRARESSADLLQSSCRELLAALDGLQFCGVDEFRGWLFTAVLHKLQKHERDLRAARRDPRRERAIDSALGAAQPPAAEPTPPQQLAAVERQQRLMAAIQSLPDDQRRVLELARIQELPRSEIARRLGRTEASVRSLLTRALRGLAERLGETTTTWK